MPTRRKDKSQSIDCSKSSSAPQNQDCFEGERLASLLQSIQREIKSARLSDRNSLPEKIWLKKQFAIGVNDVTRVLERMTPNSQIGSGALRPHIIRNHKAPIVRLQAILIAADCHPRWLTKHLPSLALSTKVPVILVKDNKRGSLRLGDLVKLKTAIAIGVKDNGSAINRLFEETIQENHLRTEYPSSTDMPGLDGQYHINE